MVSFLQEYTHMHGHQLVSSPSLRQTEFYKQEETKRTLHGIIYSCIHAKGLHTEVNTLLGNRGVALAKVKTKSHCSTIVNGELTMGKMQLLYTAFLAVRQHNSYPCIIVVDSACADLEFNC